LWFGIFSNIEFVRIIEIGYWSSLKSLLTDLHTLQEEAKKQEKEKLKEQPMAAEEDIALKEMEGPTAREAEELAKAKKPDKQEQLCNISQALAVLASASVFFSAIYLY
jgi:hypothetical protein